MAKQAPEITLQDLNAAVQIIDLASARGAIRGEEMAAIGNVRSRIAAFVKFQTDESADSEFGDSDVEAENVDDVPTTE